MSTAADRVEAFLDDHERILGAGAEIDLNGELAAADLRALIDQARKAPDRSYGPEARAEQQPTVADDGDEVHPAFGMIRASRVSGQGSLFDSEILHQHYVTIEISGATRTRNLNRDWIHAGRMPMFEVAMSEAQWASFVSSMNTSGVPCTLRRDQMSGDLPTLPFAPRMQQSQDEVRHAADKALAKIREALAQYEAKKNVGNLRALKFAIQNAPANMAFAAQSLTEHAENVVTKARVDIEAMVVARAHQLGLTGDEASTILDPTATPQAIESPHQED